MPTLSDLPVIVGFFSYSRDDDEDFDHALSKLRTRIQNELRGQLGRSKETLRLWQDREAIPPGTLWASEIKAAIDQSVFFIPIVSPRVVRSEHCGVEFQEFLERERQLGRRDLVFPILFINVPGLNEQKAQGERPVLKVIAERQYVDWREFRYDSDSPGMRREVADFCAKIVTALQRTPPQEEKETRRAYEAEQAGRRRAEDEERREVERRGEIAEADARAKEAEARQRVEAVARSQRQAEEERRAKATQVRVPNEPQPTGQNRQPAAAAARAEQHQPQLERKWSRTIGAMLIVSGIIQCALTIVFFIIAVQNGISKFGVFLMLGLLMVEISTIAVGAGEIWRKRWATLAGLPISVLGSGYCLLWIVITRTNIVFFIPFIIFSIVYIASILYFLRQLRSRSENQQQTGA